MAVPVPWSTILQALPTVVVTAKDLWQHWSSRKSAPVDPHADARTQLASVAEKLAALESAETEQAKIVSQIAEQLQGIARRVSITYWLAISGLALSCAALLLAALR
jgi:hypothetical protein